jgi:hypothetical protein
VKTEVVDVQKIGRVIVHRLKGASKPKEGAKVKGTINWEQRYALMKAHTATHKPQPLHLSLSISTFPGLVAFAAWSKGVLHNFIISTFCAGIRQQLEI